MIKLLKEAISEAKNMRFYRNMRKYLFIGSLVLIGLLLWIFQPANSQQPVPLPLPESTEEIIVDRTKYAPATYGIPDAIGGYEILAVFTSANTVCLPDGVTELLVTAREPGIEQFLDRLISGSFHERVKTLNLPVVSTIVVRSDADLNQILIDRERTNQFMAERGCIRSGPVPEGVMSPG